MPEDPNSKILLLLGELKSEARRNREYVQSVSKSLKEHGSSVEAKFDKVFAEIRTEREKRAAFENQGKGLLWAVGAVSGSVVALVTGAWGYFKG